MCEFETAELWLKRCGEFISERIGNEPGRRSQIGGRGLYWKERARFFF